MSETQALLGKIAALRQRLEQAQGLIHEAGAAPNGGGPAAGLERKVDAGARQTALLGGTLRPLAGDGPEAPALPTQLTARASRLLRRSHELLGQLRALGDEPALHQERDALAALYRETVAMCETVLRTVQAFPESPTAQLRLCAGLEGIVEVIAERVARIGSAASARQAEQGRIAELAALLAGLADGSGLSLEPFLALAEAIHLDAQQARPLRFYHAAADRIAQPEHFIAAHSLLVAQVIARLTRHDPEWRGRLHEPVLAALVHDVGMLTLPAGLLATAGPLDETQRRLVETHAAAGAESVARLSPYCPALVEATATHHERLDGTGYPAGLRDLQIKQLARLLAVCDTYAALCSPRPHRPAAETRTAITDMLLAAEQGGLDRHQAEKLLLLSFYPPGCLVELTDGCAGVVVATHQSRRDLSSPARPVVALLTDGEGNALPAPAHLDLAECEGRSVLRSLPAGNLRDLLGKRYPEWV